MSGRAWRALLGVAAALAALTSCAEGPRIGALSLGGPPEATYLAGEWTERGEDFREGKREDVALTREGALGLAWREGIGYGRQGTYTSPAWKAPSAFNAVVTRWDTDVPEGTSLSLELRTSQDGRDWSPWQLVAPDPDEWTEESYGRVSTWLAAEHLQYRVMMETRDPEATPLLREVSLTAVDTRQGPDLGAAKGMVKKLASDGGVPPPAIISRRGWGCDESMATWEPEYRPVEAFIIHHTVTGNGDPDPVATVRAIYYYHAVTRGWGDIGYNYLIDAQGNIYEGRTGGEGVVGGHALDYNYGSVGIALLGDYSATPVSQASERALAELLAWIADKRGIDPRGQRRFIDQMLPSIMGHRDVGTTSCPGDRAYNRLPLIREGVWERMLGVDPRVSFDLPRDGSKLGGKVEVLISSSSPTVNEVEFYVDDVLMASGPSPLEWSWDSSRGSDGERSLRAVALGVSGRRAEKVVKVKVDNTPPRGSLRIEEGSRYVSTPLVSLRLKAEDGASGVARMQVWDGETPVGELEPYAPTKDWILPYGDGLKRVGARFLDEMGHVSPIYTATVTLDTTPPGGWELDKGRNGLEVGVTDPTSGPDPETAAYRVAGDGAGSWGDWIPVPRAMTVSGKSGTISLREAVEGSTLQFRVGDLAGNQGLSPAWAIGDQDAVISVPTPEATTPESLPDLVVWNMTAEPAQPTEGGPITVTLKVVNQGQAESRGFWVELYGDPREKPTLNSICTELGTGAFWYVEGLGAGQAVTLTTESVYEAYSGYPKAWEAGQHRFYALADAYGRKGQKGLVREGDEANNLLGPLVLDVRGEAFWEILTQLSGLINRWLATLREVRT